MLSYLAKKPIPKSIIDPISGDKILPLILISMNMGLLDGLHPVNHREKKVVRDLVHAWEFIQSWSADLFYRQFRLPREEFFVLCERLKSNYPGFTTFF